MANSQIKSRSGDTDESVPVFFVLVGNKTDQPPNPDENEEPRVRSIYLLSFSYSERSLTFVVFRFPKKGLRSGVKGMEEFRMWRPVQRTVIT